MEYRKKAIYYLSFAIMGIIILITILQFFPGTKTYDNANGSSGCSICKDDGNYLDPITNLTLMIDYNNGTVETLENKTLSGIAREERTALYFTMKYCEVEYTDYGWGKLVTKINGNAGNWLYYVNNCFPSIGSQGCILHSSDIVKWVRIS